MNQDLFEELVTLYLLDELNSQEKESLESKTNTQELLDSFHALAYGAPQVDISSDLKFRILQKINTEETGFVPQRFHNLTWKPHPVVKGIDLALLHTDFARREVYYLVRCKPNVSYPSHQHQSWEKILIIDGTIEIDGEVYSKGDFLMSSPESIHAPQVPQGCLFYVHTSLDDRFVEWTPAMIWQLIIHRWATKP